MSIDAEIFQRVAARVIRDQTRDLTRHMPANERAEFIDSEALSLAYLLAVMAEGRTTELRADLAARA